MPLYAYRCKKCWERIEEIQKLSDPPLEKCEACGGKLEKQISNPSFRLKGSGWHRDGYTSKGSGKDVAKQTREKLTGSSD